MEILDEEFKKFYKTLFLAEEEEGVKEALPLLEGLKEDRKAKEYLFFKVFDDFQRAINDVHKVFRAKDFEGYVVLYTHCLSWETRVAFVQRLTKEDWRLAEEITVRAPWKKLLG